MNTTPSADRPRDYGGDLMAMGQQGEQIVLEWLRKQPGIAQVIDLSKEGQLYATDADFLIKLRDGRDELAEIKTDRHFYGNGNLVYELARIYHLARPENSVQLGWSARTMAKWLIVYSPTENAIYKFALEDVRKVMQVYTGKNRANARVTWISSDQTKSTLVILLPMRELEGTYRRFQL